MAKKRKQSKLSKQIRDAVDTCGVSRYRICKETGIDQPTLSRFMSGQRGITITKLDKLGEYLGLQIVVDKRRNTTMRKG